MSVQIMSLVFQHYPGQGGELVLALALADHAADDGRNIFPSISELAKKTRQSERTVQRQLKSMEEQQWLQCEFRSNGGRNRVSRYRVNPAWIADPKVALNGDILSPFHPDKPRQNVTVSAPETVTSEARNPDTAVSPARNHQEPSVNPLSTIRTTTSTPGSAEPSDGERVDAVDAELASEMLAKLRALNPKHREPNLRRWCRELRLMRERDGRTPTEIRVLFAWANADPFWQGNILSPGKLREKWDQLELRRRASRGSQFQSGDIGESKDEKRCSRTHPAGGRCIKPAVRFVHRGWYCGACADAVEDQQDRGNRDGG